MDYSGTYCFCCITFDLFLREKNKFNITVWILFSVNIYIGSFQIDLNYKKIVKVLQQERITVITKSNKKVNHLIKYTLWCSQTTNNYNIVISIQTFLEKY